MSGYSDTLEVTVPSRNRRSPSIESCCFLWHMGSRAQSEGQISSRARSERHLGVKVCASTADSRCVLQPGTPGHAHGDVERGHEQQARYFRDVLA